MSRLYLPAELPPEHIWLTASSLTDALDGLGQLRMALSASSREKESDEQDEV